METIDLLLKWFLSTFVCNFSSSVGQPKKKREVGTESGLRMIRAGMVQKYRVKEWIKFVKLLE